MIRRLRARLAFWLCPELKRLYVDREVSDWAESQPTETTIVFTPDPDRFGTSAPNVTINWKDTA